MKLYIQFYSQVLQWQNFTNFKFQVICTLFWFLICIRFVRNFNSKNNQKVINLSATECFYGIQYYEYIQNSCEWASERYPLKIWTICLVYILSGYDTPAVINYYHKIRQTGCSSTIFRNCNDNFKSFERFKTI